MTHELAALAFALLLQGAQLGLLSRAVTSEIGYEPALGPRDSMPPFSPRTARIQRALSNHFEALTLFAPAVMIVVLSGTGSWFTALCGWLYLGARLLYIPAYIGGWVPGRTLIWMVGFGATMAMVCAALLSALI